FSLLATFFRALRGVFTRGGNVVMFSLSVAIFQIIYSQTEVLFAQPSSGGWIWLTMSATFLNMVERGNPSK
ncbi:MAG: hypothetical protein QM690_11725, partial [Sphingobium sp.]